MSGTKILEKLAELLDYPGPEFAKRVKDAISLLAPVHREGLGLMEKFDSFIKSNPMSLLEEIYTYTFDLQPVCCLYVGHHLFGEGHRRGIFMAELKEHYQLHGFSSGHELPDHLGIMLRFIAKCGAEEQELVQDCVLPVLKKMLEILDKGTNPYGALLQVVLLSLQRGVYRMISFPLEGGRPEWG